MNREEERIRNLERAFEEMRRPQSLADQHIVETVSASGVASDMYALHAAGGGENFGVWVAPIALHRPMTVSRVVACINSGAPLTAAGGALGIYRARPFRLRSEEPLRTDDPLVLDRLANFAAFSTDTAEIGKLLIQLGQRHVRLDPARGHFFVGFQGDQNLRWFCPTGGLATIQRLNAMKTSPLGASAGDLPNVLTVTANESVRVPWVVLQSPVGVKLYGDRVDDD